MAEKLGEAVLTLKTDAKGFTKGVDKAEGKARKLEKRFGSLGKSLKAIGGPLKSAGIAIGVMGAAAAVAAAGVFLLTKRIAEQGDVLAKTSKRLGLSIEALQKFQFAAERSGLAANQVQKALFNFSRAVDEIQSGDITELGKALLRLDEGFEKIIKDGATLEDLLPLIAERAKELGVGFKLAGIFSDLFGAKIGAGLIPLFLEGEEGLAALGNELERYGLVTDKQAKQSEEFVDSLENISRVLKALKFAMTEDLIPAMTQTIQTITDWIAENKELIAQKVRAFINDVIEGMRLLIEVNNDISVLFAVTLPRDISITRIAFETLAEVIIGASTIMLGLLTMANEFNKIALPEFLTPDVDKSIKRFAEGIEAAQIALNKSKVAARETGKELEFLTEVQQNLIDVTSGLGVEFKRTGIEIERTGKKTKVAKTEVETLSDSIVKQNEALRIQIATFGFTTEEIIEFNRALNISKGVLPEVANETADLQLALKKLGDEAEEAAKKWEEVFRLQFEVLGRFGEDLFPQEARLNLVAFFEEFTEESENELDSFAVFVSSTFANIAQDIGNAIIEARNVWEAVVNSFKRLLADLIGFFIANPIRVFFQQAFAGGAPGVGAAAGGGGGFGDVLGGVGGLFAGGFSAITALPGAFGSLFTGGLGAAPGVAALTGGALTGAGSIAASLAAIATGIGAIVAIGIAIFAGFKIIQGLLADKPRLDIDFVRVKALAKLGIEGTVGLFAQFDELNEETQKALIGVKGKGGVEDSLKGVREVLADIIQATIEGIQSVINRLPRELAAELDAILLATVIDNEEFQGDMRILELDVRSGFKERLEAFFKGLPGTFGIAIREGIAEMLVALGVQFEGAQAIVDEAFERFQAIKGVGAEAIAARAAIGEELLELFETFVDVFNILNNTASDAFQVAIEGIKSLSDELGIITKDGIPSLEQIEDALRDLFESGELTAEVAQKFILLRSALIELTVALVQSIASIVQITSALGADIAGLGGGPVDFTREIDALRESIAALRELLASDAGLTSQEREAILRELNAQTQLLEALLRQQPQEVLGAFDLAEDARRIAMELAEDQKKAIEAQIAALNASIEALERSKDRIREVGRVRIDFLNREADRIKENAKLRIEALDKELDRAKFIKNIQENIRNLMLGSTSIETVFARLELARGEVARLLREIPGATPEQAIALGTEAQQLINQIDALRLEAFQAPSPEARALFRQMILDLEALQELIGPTRTMEEIQASIELIEKESEAHLEAIETTIDQINQNTERQLNAIDQSIANMRSQLTNLQNESNALQGTLINLVGEIGVTANDLTEAEIAELLEIKEFLRDQFFLMLDQRVDQLREISLAQAQVNVSIEIRNAVIDLVNTLRVAQGLLPRPIPVPLPAQHGLHGVLRDDTTIFAHAGERVDISPLGEGGGGISILIDRIIIQGDRNPKQYEDKFIAALHSGRVVREIKRLARDQ